MPIGAAIAESATAPFWTNERRVVFPFMLTCQYGCKSPHQRLVANSVLGERRHTLRRSRRDESNVSVFNFTLEAV